MCMTALQIHNFPLQFRRHFQTYDAELCMNEYAMNNIAIGVQRASTIY